MILILLLFMWVLQWIIFYLISNIGFENYN